MGRSPAELEIDMIMSKQSLYI